MVRYSSRLDKYDSDDILKNDFDDEYNCDAINTYYVADDVDDVLSDIESELDSIKERFNDIKHDLLRDTDTLLDSIIEDIDNLYKAI